MVSASPKMTEEELRALCAREETSARGGISSDISNQREKALRYYFGEPLGNEEEGRSQVVSTDVADTIEWILPALMKIFTAGDEVVRFEPTEPSDEPAAKQATEYANFIFNQDNPGFMVLLTQFKDALLQKNGIVKVWWVETQETEETTPAPMSEDAYAVLVAEIDAAPGGKDKPKIEIAAHRLINPGDDDYPEAPPAVPPPMPMMPVAEPAPLHEVTLRVTRKVGRVKVCPVPPEEFLIARRARTIKDSPYTAHRFRRTLSELIADGYDRTKVMALPTDNDPTLSSSTRDEFAEDQDGLDNGRTGVMRECWMVEEYVRADMNGDGIAEMIKVLRASGSGGAILDYEEWEGTAPFSSCTPIPVPHRFIGVSIADLVMDLQLIKSQVTRGMIDNIYQVNNPREVVSNQVNLDDLLQTKLGAKIRLKNDALPGQGHIVPLTTPFTAGQSLPLLEYLDAMKENRTGVTRYNQGTNADSLNKTATGIRQIMTAAQQRIELIARIFAETGVSEMFWHILRCVQKYQDSPRLIRRVTGGFVPMDPRAWKNRFDMSVSVGLGTGNRDQMLGHLATVFGMQAQIAQAQAQFGVVMIKPQHIKNTLDKIVTNMGFKDPNEFSDPPQMLPPSPAPEDPRMAKVAADAEHNRARLEVDAADKAAGHQLDRERLQLERGKIVGDALLRAAALLKPKFEARPQ